MDELYRLLDDARLHEFTGGAPASLDELRTRFAQVETGLSPDGSHAWLAWTVRLLDTHAAIGTLQATVSAAGISTVSWVIGVAYQRKGYATEAASLLVEWLATRPGIAEVRAFIHPANEASMRVARSCGLRPTSELVDGEVVWTRLVS